MTTGMKHLAAYQANLLDYYQATGTFPVRHGF